MYDVRGPSAVPVSGSAVAVACGGGSGRCAGPAATCRMSASTDRLKRTLMFKSSRLAGPYAQACSVGFGILPGSVTWQTMLANLQARRRTLCTSSDHPYDHQSADACGLSAGKQTTPKSTWSAPRNRSSFTARPERLPITKRPPAARRCRAATLRTVPADRAGQRVCRAQQAARVHHASRQGAQAAGASAAMRKRHDRALIILHSDGNTTAGNSWTASCCTARGADILPGGLDNLG